MRVYNKRRFHKMKLRIRKYRPTHEPSSSFRKFLQTWEKPDKYIEEYLGLMHHLANQMHGNHHLDNISEMEILRFFLHYSSNANGLIAMKAKQMLVGYCLPEWKGFASPGAELFHKSFQRTFSKPFKSLLYKSYCDSIRDYALKFRHLIVGYGAPITGLTLSGLDCHTQVQPLFKSYVKLAINWCVVDEVHHRNIKPEFRIRELEKILESHLSTYRPVVGGGGDTLSYMFAIT